TPTRDPGGGGTTSNTLLPEHSTAGMAFVTGGGPPQDTLHHGIENARLGPRRVDTGVRRQTSPDPVQSMSIFLLHECAQVIAQDRCLISLAIPCSEQEDDRTFS